MEEVMEENTEEKHPIMIAIEKEGYQILSFKCKTRDIYDPDKDKIGKSPVLTIRVTPNKEFKMFSMAD
jgi:hypothetical protein